MNEPERILRTTRCCIDEALREVLEAFRTHDPEDLPPARSEEPMTQEPNSAREDLPTERQLRSEWCGSRDGQAKQEGRHKDSTPRLMM